MDMFCVNLIAKDLWGKNRSAYFSSSVLNDAGDKGKNSMKKTLHQESNIGLMVN